MPFSVSASHPGYHIPFSSFVFLGLLLTVTLYQISFVFKDLAILKSPGQGSCKMFFVWNLSDVFWWFRQGSLVWGMTSKVKGHCRHIILRVQSINMTCHSRAKLWSLGWGRVCQGSPVKVTLSSPTFLIALEEHHCMQPTVKKWAVILHHLKGGVSTHIIWNSIALEIYHSLCFFALLIYSIVDL